MQNIFLIYSLKLSIIIISDLIVNKNMFLIYILNKLNKLSFYIKSKSNKVYSYKIKFILKNEIPNEKISDFSGLN